MKTHSGPHSPTLLDLPIRQIHLGIRHRKDMGDLRSLAKSIEQEGLLQPIGVTEKFLLVFGERRLRAFRDVLKRKTIPTRIVRVSSIVSGEYHENEVRKDFTPSERVAIAKAVERLVGNRRGQRTDKERVQKIAQVDAGKKTRDEAAEKAGFGNHETYRQASKVVNNGTPRLVLAMDQGKVSISAAALLADADPDEQDQILDLDEKAILKAAKEIRQRQTAERINDQKAAEKKARIGLNGKQQWTITADQRVIPCHLLLADPPYGITNEPWEPDDLESFTRDWCSRWVKCGADFIAIFWSQGRLFEGRQWLDESLDGYRFQQILIWHANNSVGPKTIKWFKQSWEPVFLYRKVGTTRNVISNTKPWTAELHNLDLHVAPVPQTNFGGEDLKQHPCQKPLSVMRWLIHALSEPRELVVSPFAGAAPCGIAALQLGRRYHGIEISKAYRKMAERRLATYGA